MRGAILPLSQYAFMAWCSKIHGDSYVPVVLTPTKESRYFMDMRLGGSQGSLGCGGEDKSSSLPRIESCS